jgi:threonine synthase
VSHFANQAVRGYLRANGLTPLDTKSLALEATKEDSDNWSIPTLTSNVLKDRLPHLVIASGGNAGLAAASAAGILGVPCTVFVPDEQASIQHLFNRYGPNVKVRVGGKDYEAASRVARLFVDELGDKGYASLSNSSP